MTKRLRDRIVGAVSSLDRLCDDFKMTGANKATMRKARAVLWDINAYFRSTESSNPDNHPFNSNMDEAPQDGTRIELFGSYPKTEEEVVVLGLYDSGGYTEGWVSATRYNVFYPTAWRYPVLSWKELQ